MKPSTRTKKHNLPTKALTTAPAPSRPRPVKRRKVTPEPEPEIESEPESREEQEAESSSEDVGLEDALEGDAEEEVEGGEEEAESADGEEDEQARSTSEPDEADQKSFSDLGVEDVLCDACKALGYKFPTPIQAAAIPPALEGRDLIGVAVTGSGKTAAFALPILQSLLETPRPFYGLVIAPTRELAIQIGKAFSGMGASINAKIAVLTGGVNMVDQMVSLGKKPHVIVATPGRLLDHLERTKGFSLHRLEYLVLDEADKLLELDFGPVIEKILSKLPRERKTYLFSATMSTKVEGLQRASLIDPLKISVNAPNEQTAKKLKQQLWVVPQMHKDLCLVYLMNNFAGKSIIVFVRTFRECQRAAILLRQLGFGAVPLYGKLPMTARISVMNKFRERSRDILVATDVAARGLDIPAVDLVVNFDLPQDSKTYIHRVGRTARAGRVGTAINMCTQYDIEVFLRIEHFLGSKMDVYEEYDEELLKPLMFRVEDAQRVAKREMKDLDQKGKDRNKSRGRGAGAAGGGGGGGKRQRGGDRDEDGG